jgi:hypothetical protein
MALGPLAQPACDRHGQENVIMRAARDGERAKPCSPAVRGGASGRRTGRTGRTGSRSRVQRRPKHGREPSRRPQRSGCWWTGRGRGNGRRTHHAARTISRSLDSPAWSALLPKKLTSRTSPMVERLADVGGKSPGTPGDRNPVPGS